MEEGCRWTGVNLRTGGDLSMALEPAITDIEQLKEYPAMARLLAWNRDVVQGVKFDREEMTIYVERGDLREACVLLTRSGVPVQLPL